MAGDWLRLYRAMLDHPVMQDDFLCRLWIWCILKANYKPKQFRGTLVPPGSFVTGRNTAASELNVNPSKWYRGMQRLCQMECITMVPNNHWTTVSVCKWSTYQSDGSQQRTTSEQPSNNQRTQEKEGKKERIKTPLPPKGGTPKTAGISLSDLSDPEAIQRWMNRRSKSLDLRNDHESWTWLVAAGLRAVEVGDDPVGLFISLAKEFAIGDTSKLEAYRDRAKVAVRNHNPAAIVAASNGVDHDDA